MEELRETVVISEDEEGFEEKLRQAALALREGALVVFPTETVFGLGANAYDEVACRGIYQAKGRPSDNPLIVHIDSLEMAKELMLGENPLFEELGRAFFPGPLSLVVKKSPRVSSVVSGGLDTVALRLPDNETARKLIHYAGVPIAAPSANLSGRPSPTRNEHVLRDLKGRVDYIILSSKRPIGVESTVLDISSEELVIYRPGGISKERIELALSRKVSYYDGKELKEGISPKSPGIKYKHYSPEALVYESERRLSQEELKTLAEEHHLSLDELIYLEYESDVEMASNLYADFRAADIQGKKLIIVKAAESGELLAAVLNRLTRATSSKLAYFSN